MDLSFDLEATGFEIPEIDLLIDGLDVVEKTDADDLISATSGPSVTRAGDLWQLGKHRVLCGDALQADSYAALMSGVKANLVITDPPYNVAIDGHASGLGKVHHREFSMASGEMSGIQFTNFLLKAMISARDHSSVGSLGYWFMDWRHQTEILSAGSVVYDELLNVCVWTKTNAGMGSFYRSAHELIFLFKNGKSSHRNNVQLGKFGRYRTNVWSYPGANTFSRSGSEGDLLSFTRPRSRSHSSPMRSRTAPREETSSWTRFWVRDMRDRSRAHRSCVLRTRVRSSLCRHCDPPVGTRHQTGGRLAADR